MSTKSLKTQTKNRAAALRKETNTNETDVIAAPEKWKPPFTSMKELLEAYKAEKPSRDRWIAKYSYPLVPDEKILLVSLTGQDYPKLRAAFAQAWERMFRNDRNVLVRRWRKAKGEIMYPAIPWIVALPSWPSREKDEFAMTHPSGYSIRFIGPLFEIMPEEVAVGLVIQELTFAFYLAGQDNHNPLWAKLPRRLWAGNFIEDVKTFERLAGIPDFDGLLQAWITGNPELDALSDELEQHAYWLFNSVGEDANLIYS